MQEALGELAGAAKEGLLAVSVGVGLSVLAELMSPKSTRSWARRASTTRTAARCATATRLAKSRSAAARVGVKRPAGARGRRLGETPFQTYRHFADRDPLTAVVLGQMLAGVSTRRFSRTRERSASRWSTRSARRQSRRSGREFVGRTREHLVALMSRRLDDMRLAALAPDPDVPIDVKRVVGCGRSGRLRS